MPPLVSEGHSERLSGGYGGRATAQLSWEMRASLSSPFSSFLLPVHLIFFFLLEGMSCHHSQDGWPGVGEFSSEEQAENSA